MWALTPPANRAAGPPKEDFDRLVDFQDIALKSSEQPDDIDHVIAWVEELVSKLRKLTASSYVSLLSLSGFVQL